MSLLIERELLGGKIGRIRRSWWKYKNWVCKKLYLAQASWGFLFPEPPGKPKAGFEPTEGMTVGRRRRRPSTSVFSTDWG